MTRVKFGVRTLARLQGLSLVLLVCIFAFSTAATATAANKCNTSTLKGSYGHLVNGTILGFGPFTVVGVATFDGDGKWSRVETSNVNGQVFPETLTGTYTVNPDCSGTAHMTNGETSAFVIVDGGRKILAMGTDPNAVLTVVLEKQSAASD